MNQYKKTSTFNPVGQRFKHEDKSVEKLLNKLADEINKTRSMVNQELTNLERTSSGGQSDIVQNIISGGGSGVSAGLDSRILSLELTVETLSLVISAIKSIRTINQSVSAGSQTITFASPMASDCVVLSVKLIDSDGAISDLLASVSGESSNGFTVVVPLAGTLKGYAIES
jgi:hypothetical protein